MRYIHISEKERVINSTEKTSSESGSFSMIFHDKLKGKGEQPHDEQQQQQRKQQQQAPIELHLSKAALKKSRSSNEVSCDLDIDDYETIDCSGSDHSIDIEA